MNILPALLISFGLSMDNLAVAVTAGSTGRLLSKQKILEISALFALAHFIMFSVGFLGGYELTRWLENIAKWVSSVILFYIGSHMVWQSIRGEGEEVVSLQSFSTCCLLAVATSMDALFVGMGLAIAGGTFLLLVSFLTGSVLLTSIIGFYAGRWLGNRFGRIMESIGGIILISFGVKVLL